MSDQSSSIERRTLLKGAMVMAGMVSVAETVTQAAAQPVAQAGAAGGARLADLPLSPDTRVTVERRGQIVLIGINRPEVFNRMDPEATHALAVALTGYDRDDSLRCAILFGHGDNFSRGIDVDAHKSAIGTAPAPAPDAVPLISLTGDNPKTRLSKPLIVVTHGDTWNLGHEMHLAADIRICSADVRFGQDETSHARFPGGGGTIRFVREAGWGNAMRYILTGDHWGAQEAYRMGEVQEVAPNRDAAIDAAMRIANKVAACAPLGIKATLESAHLAIDSGEIEAFGQMGKAYNALYSTRDYQEGRDAEAQNRPGVYIGK
jgi:enoyl-CoA hydratase/carnithine racemase